MTKIRVTRVLVYEGEEEWVRRSLDPFHSYVRADTPFVAGRGSITEIERKEERVNDRAN